MSRKVTHIHHVEVTVDLSIVIDNPLLNLTNAQLLFTQLDLFVLKTKEKTRLIAMEANFKSVQAPCKKKMKTFTVS